MRTDSKVRATGMFMIHTWGGRRGGSPLGVLTASTCALMFFAMDSPSSAKVLESKRSAQPSQNAQEWCISHCLHAWRYAAAMDPLAPPSLSIMFTEALRKSTAEQHSTGSRGCQSPRCTLTCLRESRQPGHHTHVLHQEGLEPDLEHQEACRAPCPQLPYGSHPAAAQP